jgi:hypothetical protein
MLVRCFLFRCKHLEVSNYLEVKFTQAKQDGPSKKKIQVTLDLESPSKINTTHPTTNKYSGKLVLVLTKVCQNSLNEIKIINQKFVILTNY